MKWSIEKYHELELLAKSPEYGSLPLPEHLQHVSESACKIAEASGLDKKLARIGGFLHDIGKAHPTYQAFVYGYRKKEDFLLEAVHRHELSSLMFLPAFSESLWPALTEMIVAHHKSLSNDKRRKGLNDLLEEDSLESVFDNHARFWADWVPRASSILYNFGIDATSVNKDQAEKAFTWVAEFCEDTDFDWSPWRGVLMAGDHMSSALMNKQGPHLDKLFKKPNYVNIDPPHELYPLSMADYKDIRPHTLVVAPTGAGKTDFLLRRCRGRTFYTLPFQASINAMHERLKKLTEKGTDVRVLHSSSRLVHGQTQEEVQLQPFVGASVKVMTPHQLSALAFGTMGFEAVMLDVKDCDVILDEIHTYDFISQAMVIAIVDVLLRQNCRIHIGTATMPGVLYKTLFNLLGGKKTVHEVALTGDQLDTYDRHNIYKINEDEALDKVREGLSNGEKVLIVFNTVHAAQEFYRVLKAAFNDVPSMLIHSRFRRKDRNERETLLKDYFNKLNEACFVVSTQVVEVSLDISFSRMITQAAPFDSLIQRFGRINRTRLAADQRSIKPVYVIEPGDNTLPYKKEIVQSSFEQLSDGEILKTKELQERIDAVYPTVDMQSIDAQIMITRDDIVLKKLTHNPKAVLMDLLDIDSINCILAEDREKYENADWEERKWLEIPVPFSSIRKIKNQLMQVDQVGSEPFIMDDQNEYDELGLIIKSQNQFI
ncbi:MAG: CRISPR-associated helicase Cas3' [Brumimicrobium sp.]